MTGTTGEVTEPRLGAMGSALLQERIRARIEAGAHGPADPPAPMVNRVTGRWFCSDCGRDLERHGRGGWMCPGLGVWWPRPDEPEAWFPLRGVRAEAGSAVGAHGPVPVIRLTLTDSDGMVRRVAASAETMERVYHGLAALLGRGR